MGERKRYWFPAKRYGWGWGLPVTWEGWVVFLGYVVALAGCASGYAERGLLQFVGGVALLSVIFLGVCFWKGEPPRWRWGKWEE